MSSRANRQEARRAGFKKAIDGDEARRKREDHQVEIRKAKREENLMKKRRETTPALGAEPGDGSLPETTIDALGRATDADLSRLSVMVAGIQSGNPTEQMGFTLEFRKLLSIGTCGRGVCVCVGWWGRGLQLKCWPRPLFCLPSTKTWRVEFGSLLTSVVSIGVWSCPLLLVFSSSHHFSHALLRVPASSVLLFFFECRAQPAHRPGYCPRGCPPLCLFPQGRDHAPTAV